MLSQRFGVLLREARQQLAMRREDLARRAGVSTRLVAELERGQRPNVSLESALKLLAIVGVTVSAQAPDGTVAEIRTPSAAALQRTARAAHRRRTWKGGHVRLHEQGEPPPLGRSAASRTAALSAVSKQAFALDGMRRPR